MGFADLKKNSNIDRLSSAMENLDKKKSSNGDDRQWKLTVDKAGTGHAIIRFLPAPEGEDLPWVRIFDHGFQGPGGWYIEKSLTTLEQKDPCSEYNSTLWNNDTEAGKDQARKQKRRLGYHANILVVDDPANPENNGRVFLYRFGAKIFEKIKDAMSPEFSTDEAFDPFNLWNGANFKLRAKQVAGYRNYDSSEFAAVSEVGADDTEREAVWGKEYSLQSLIGPNEFKSYDELKLRLTQVLGLDAASAAAPTAAPVAAPVVAAPSLPTAEQSVGTTDGGDSDDGLDFFNDLLND